jgi:integrase
MGQLTARKVQTEDEPGRHADGNGNGLYLNVAPKGSKSWVQRIAINGHKRDIGLGSYPTIGLARAREMAHANKVAVAEGRDPLKEKREAREAARSPSPSIPTFAEAASSVIELRRPIWSNPKHAAQWESTLATYAFPAIGNRPVDRITSGDVLAILTPIWTAIHETASRVRQRMEVVFDWAIATGWRLDNPAGKAVLRVLPRTSMLKSNHRSLPYGEVPEALRRVRESAADPVTRLSFEFLVLTAARSGEVRKATWSEIDLKSATWTVPEERMKARREHRVPLSGRCLEILAEARELNRRDGALIFPALSGKPLSDMTYGALLRREEVPAVAHGFRSSFKNWSLKASGIPDRDLLSELALAHEVGNETKKAYLTTDLLEERMPLMEAWAGFCQSVGEFPVDAGVD